MPHRIINSRDDLDEFILLGWSKIGLTRETAQKMAAEYWRLWKGDKGKLS